MKRYTDVPDGTLCILFDYFISCLYIENCRGFIARLWGNGCMLKIFHVKVQSVPELLPQRFLGLLFSGIIYIGAAEEYAAQLPGFGCGRY